MLLTTLASLLLAVGAAAVPHDKRATVSEVTVYAYGTGINGLPVLTSSDGIAYVSSEAASNLSQVTWTIASGGTVPWNVTANTDTNTTTTTTNTTSTFYIVTTADAYEPIGFVSSNETAPTGAETVGFTIYGSDVMFISDSTFESQFWALATNATDEWEIRWNSNGASQDNSVPVTLKTTGPTS